MLIFSPRMCLPKVADESFCKTKLNETLARRELANSSYLVSVREVLGDELESKEKEALAGSSKVQETMAMWWPKLQLVFCGFLGALVALAAGRVGKCMTRYCTLSKCNFRTRRGFQSFSDDGDDSATTATSTGIENTGARLQEVELEEQAGRESARVNETEEAVEATEESAGQS